MVGREGCKKVGKENEEDEEAGYHSILLKEGTKYKIQEKDL